MLNVEQQKVCQTDENVILVIAGPGTGKTTTLAHRLKYLLCDTKQIQQPLFLTFSRAAKVELKKKIAQILDGQWDSVVIQTFDAFATKILCTNLQTNKGVVIDNSDKRKIINQFLRSKHITVSDKGLLELLSLMNHLITEEWERCEIEQNYDDPKHQQLFDSFKEKHHSSMKKFEWSNFQELWKKYNDQMNAQKLWDHHTIMIKVLKLLQNDEFLDQIQQKYDYIFVDEFQDLNKLQYCLLRKITQTQKKCCVVGDPCQCVYEWRGADVEIFDKFIKNMENNVQFQLTVNYRSTPKIINTINSFSTKLSKHLTLKSSCDNHQCPDVYFHKFIKSDSFEEGKWIVRKIKLLISSGMEAQNIAILIRKDVVYMQKKIKISKNMKNMLSEQNIGDVKIMTVNNAKGQEFEGVFVMGVGVDGYFPDPRGELWSENNLFYVAISRAKKYLYLSATYSEDSGCDFLEGMEQCEDFKIISHPKHVI